jgi:hypothetical protein
MNFETEIFVWTILVLSLILYIFIIYKILEFFLNLLVEVYRLLEILVYKLVEIFTPIKMLKRLNSTVQQGQQTIEETLQMTPTKLSKQQPIHPYLVDETTDTYSTINVETKGPNGETESWKKIVYTFPKTIVESGNLKFDQKYERWILEVKNLSDFDNFANKVEKLYPNDKVNKRIKKNNQGVLQHVYSEKGLETVYYTQLGSFKDKMLQGNKNITRSEAISEVINTENFTEVHSILKGTFKYKGEIYLDIVMKKVIIKALNPQKSENEPEGE